MKPTFPLAIQPKTWLKDGLVGSLLFLGLAQHLLNFWNLAAWQMALLFAAGLPILSGLSAFLTARLTPRFAEMPKRLLALFVLTALLLAGFISWRLYRSPDSYQQVTVTALAGQVGLIELKANAQVIPLQKAAAESGWYEQDGFYFPAASAQPLQISFLAPVGKPVTLLFLTSPQGGQAGVTLNIQRQQAGLSNQRNGQTRLQLTSGYRGLPAWAFLTVWVLADLLTFGVAVLLVLLVQEIGQTRSSDSPAKAPKTRLDLTILLAFGLLLHTVNMLSVPTLLNADSPAYLTGALHLIEHGSFEGASTSVGPGTTLLFAPMLWLLGRNPWGPKIILHLIGLACIPLSYRFGWQVSRSRWVAFLSGLLVANSPDIFFYANYPMSDLPNLFFVLLFCSLLLTALEQPRPVWVFALLASASFAALLRSENILLVVIGAAALAVSAFWRRYSGEQIRLWPALARIGIASLLAILPVFWWSYHNLKNNGFFGMSNYFGVVLYDGWVYFGDALGMRFSNPDSAAYQELQQMALLYPPLITDKKGVATGWETYYSLLPAGYEPERIMTLLETAARDSIKKDPRKTVELLFMKFQIGLQPDLPPVHTYPLPGEPGWGQAGGSQFFDADNLSLPPLVRLQRRAYEWAARWYGALYPAGILICIAALILGLLRRPALNWFFLTAAVASRIFIPLTVSVAFWRYSLAGWLPLQIMALSWLMLILAGLRGLRKPKSQNQ
ncbi:MAG: glycosyltransferase family 39 protein [Anaerolineales bacterium]|jgi:hypothetical protein|nr:glycosyltransferase family 39 protein [Anaerolineales bacterium]